MLDMLLDTLDTDGSGTLTYDEFTSGLRHVHKQMDQLDITRVASKVCPLNSIAIFKHPHAVDILSISILKNFICSLEYYIFNFPPPHFEPKLELMQHIIPR